MLNLIVSKHLSQFLGHAPSNLGIRALSHLDLDYVPGYNFLTYQTENNGLSNSILPHLRVNTSYLEVFF